MRGPGISHWGFLGICVVVAAPLLVGGRTPADQWRRTVEGKSAVERIVNIWASMPDEPLAWDKIDAPTATATPEPASVETDSGGVGAATQEPAATLALTPTVTLEATSTSPTGPVEEGTQASEEAGTLRTDHCGTISSDEMWSSDGSVHVITCNVTVASGVTLSITEGAVVKVEAAKTLFVAGSLRVLGTNLSPVYITSIRDDSVGGDTNGDGGATTPAPGNWTRIEFMPGSDDSASLIDHAVIRYGGYQYGPNYGAITLDDASPTVQNTEIRESGYCALAGDLHSFPTLIGNTLVNNGANGLCLFGGTLDIDATWDVTDTSYYLRDSVTLAVG